MSQANPAVLIVAYGQPGDVASALAGLDPAWATVIVDNSSDQGVAAVAEAQGADYVNPGTNLGFAGGVNLGMRHLPLDTDILVLNPDATIDADTVRALQHAMRADERVAAVSPRLVDPAGSTEVRVIWPFPTPSGMWREAVRRPTGCSIDGTFLSGAALMLRREAWNEVGAFDERFFLYAEETDWQLRAVRRGWTVKLVPTVVATHRGAGSSSDMARRESLFMAGTETYMRKWYGSSGWQSYRAAALFAASLRFVFGTPTQRKAAAYRFRIFARGPRKSAGLPAR